MPKQIFYSIIFLLLFVPLYPKFPLIGIPGSFVSVRLEDLAIALVFIIWGVSKCLSKKFFPDQPVHRAILLYLFIGAVSLFSAIFLTKTSPPSLGLLHYLRRVEYMILFFVAYDFLKTKDQLYFAVRTLILVSFLVAIYGLGQQFLNFPVISTTNSEFAKGLALTLGPGARINSTFAGHYDLAAFSIFPLLLLLGLLNLPGVKHKWLLLSIGALVYWAMLLSASRVAFAAFYLTSCTFSLLIRKKTLLILLLALGFVSILATPQLLGRYRELVINHLLSYLPVASAQTPVPVDDRPADALINPVVPEDRSLNIRLKAEWPRAIRSFLKNPVLGTGFSSVGLAVDNDYLRLLAETGLLGFVSFLLIIIRFFKSSLTFLLTPPQDVPHVFILAVSLGIIGLMLNAVFIDVFEASKVAIVTWTLAGLTQKVKDMRNSGKLV